MTSDSGSRWSTAEWAPRFPGRRQLDRELALLGQLFPDRWCDTAFRALTPGASGQGHQLGSDLLTPGGRVRVLDLAAELLRLMNSRASVPGSIPMSGRLRDVNLYPPTKSELLIGSILRPLGDLRWQPEGNGFGADYSVVHEAWPLVAEVKRAQTARRRAAESDARARVMLGRGRTADHAMGRFDFSRAEVEAHARAERKRLYPHVRKAARQLSRSARRLRPKGVPGILFLDLDGNPYLVNLRERVRSWMARPWAAPIDLVLWFDYRERDGRWGTIAEPLYSRSDRALERLRNFHRPCSQGHIHIRSRPKGPCSLRLPF